jgi:hypothetical protein
VNEAILWGALAAIVVAVVASWFSVGWITGLGHMAEVAGRIAGGDYRQRVSHESGDDIGRFCDGLQWHGRAASEDRGVATGVAGRYFITR